MNQHTELPAPAGLHFCHDCKRPIVDGSEVFLGSGLKLRAYHGDCFLPPALAVPAQRVSEDASPTRDVG